MTHKDFEEIRFLGRVELDGLAVSAADLAAADPPGLLMLTPTSGMMVEIEAGASLGGVAICGYPDTDTGEAVDETPIIGTHLPILFVRCSSGAGFTVTNNDPTMSAEHRMHVHSKTGGPDADGQIYESTRLVVYRLGGGWSVGETAP